MKKLLMSTVVVLLMMLGGGAAWAQLTSGDVAGVVKDASGAVISAAQITVTNEATNISTTATSNASGEFHIQNLLPGLYTLKVVAAGFQAYDLKALQINTATTSTADVKMVVGASTSSVEVTAASGTTLDTTTANLSTTLTTEELSVLPTATIGLGVLNTSLLVPGVASPGGIGIGTGPSVGGARPRDNNFTIEGIDNNNKSVTGPLVYVPNDAVSDFTLITTQFSPEFGHSNGGQFNTNVMSGTNKIHGVAYEYFDNKLLNAGSGNAGGIPTTRPRYDFNRYGGQAGAPIFKDKLFVFGNFERQTTGQSLTYYNCVPTAAGITTLSSLAYGFNATNLAQYLKYTPTANFLGGAQLTGAQDNACGESATGLQSATVYQGTTLTNGVYGSGASTSIPLGNQQVSAPVFTNFDALTTSGDYTISKSDNLRMRYLFNTSGTEDTASPLPAFFQALPYKYHLIALSEYHSFTPNLTNEVRIGFNRYVNNTPAGNFTFPGLDAFPDLTFLELGDIYYGPDSNAPQSTIQNLYQFTDNVSYTKGTHTISIGFDGRKYISPQTFTQRVRGDYEWKYLTEYLHDLAPTSFGQRSTGNFIYYGDQTALYGYANDTWRVTPTVTLNYGLRYEFTSVPVGMRAQSLNIAASAPGLINFGAPQPQYKNFAPRFGINWSPDEKTSIRAGFGLGYDVIFDNVGLLSFPPQYSSTNSVGDANTNYTGNTNPNAGDPNFLGGYSNVAGAPTVHGLPPGNGGLATFNSTPTASCPVNGPIAVALCKQRGATAAFVPNQVVPYAENYNLQVQRTIGNNMVFTLGYVGTHGIHLETQDQINKVPKTTAANQLFTTTSFTNGLGATGPTNVVTAANASTLAQINALSAVVPAYAAAGFTSSITSYQPFSQSNYNALTANLTRRMSNGLQMNFSYTWSHTMDDATAEVNSTGLTPRRPQNSQCIACDYSRSALDRTNRLTLEAVYDLPFFKHSNFLMKNLAGNWEIAPIYTYESPEYVTVLSGVNSNVNGDSTVIDRTIYNKNGVKGTGSASYGVYSSTLAGNCTGGATQCTANLVGYAAANPNAQYIQALAGTLPNSERNTLPIRPIDNIAATAVKRISFGDRYSVEFDANAFNLLNHPQYIPGSINTVNQKNTANVYTFNTVTSGTFNNAPKNYSNNARTLQLAAKFRF
jgi:hypothetical protein